jgi:hypothetical protein
MVEQAKHKITKFNVKIRVRIKFKLATNYGTCNRLVTSCTAPEIIMSLLKTFYVSKDPKNIIRGNHVYKNPGSG